MTRPLRILFVSYALLPVSESSCGGAEQMLWTVEQGISHLGHQTTVAACKGSEITGELHVTGEAPLEPDSYVEREAEHCLEVTRLIRRRASEGRPFDLVHDQSGAYWKHAAEIDVPILATLHLPRYFYPPRSLETAAPKVIFNGVSESQLCCFQGIPGVIGVVQNGIIVERFPFTEAKNDYLLWLGRICIEKGPHIALDVASRAGKRIILAGQVYPFTYHQEFFQHEVVPRLRDLGDRAQFIGRASLAAKVDLIRHARAVLVPSLVDETSSLVSMEAMACGTPVIAFRRGALSEVIEDGKTGFVVDTPEEMIAAVDLVDRIRPADCRRRVEEHYQAARMASDYLRLYQRVLEQEPALAA